VLPRLERELNQRVKYVRELSKEIPFYVRKYKELGIDPDEIRTPQDLLKAYEKGLYTRPEDLPQLVYYEDKNAKEFYTSGTTGKPKKVCVNPDDEKRFILQAAKYFPLFLTKEDRILNCLPGTPATSGYMENCSLSALRYSYKHAPVQKLGSDPKKFLEYYREITPTSFISLTTFAYRLPKTLESIGVDSRKLGIKSILTGGEPSSIQRRKQIGNEFEAKVYDLYASSENGMFAFESEAFTDEHIILYPETLLFLVKDKKEVSVGETGDVVITNLYPVGSKPWSLLLNYEIGDHAKCVEKDGEIVTVISNVRREVANLAGGKLDPMEIEACIDELENYKDELTGEYFIINYYDKARRAVGEIRVEGRRRISDKIREKVYSINYPVWNEVEIIGDARLLIKVTNPGELYKGYEKYIKPGKPKRLLVLPNG